MDKHQMYFAAVVVVDVAAAATTILASIILLRIEGDNCKMQHCARPA